MSFAFPELHNYLRRHKGFVSSIIRDILRVMGWKLCRKKIVVVTTGSGGVGDYLWIRNYFPIIRQNGYKVILVAMSHWKEIVEAFDKEETDVIRYLESCLSPRIIESLLFKLFKADVFLNFRKACMADIVRCKVEYNDADISSMLFYEEKNNATFSKFLPLPEGFKHLLPIIEPPVKIDNYILLVEGGNTQGRLSDEQLKEIINHLAKKKIFILYNGDYDHISSLLPPEIKDRLIDGRSYSFPQYTWLVANARFVVTVNTALYHFALQLNRPCVVISCNEYNTLKLHQPNQEYVFNNSLQEKYIINDLISYSSNTNDTLNSIDNKKIIAAIDRIMDLL